MKKFVGIFKVQNGEAQYTMLVKTEADTKKEAEKYFKSYNTPEKEIGFPDAWQLRYTVEVKTFDDLWQLI